MKAEDKQENPEYSDFKYIRSDIIYDIFSHFTNILQVSQHNISCLWRNAF